MSFIFTKLDHLMHWYLFNRKRLPYFFIDFYKIEDDIKEYKKQFLETLIPSRKQFIDKVSAKSFMKLYKE